MPKSDQDIIRRFSGEWTAERYIATYDAENKAAIEQLRSDTNRKVVVPSAADRDETNAAFRAVIENWMSANPHNRELMTRAEFEIAKICSGS